MNIKCLPIILFTWIFALTANAGTPAQAEAVLVEYNAKFKAWESKLALARSMEEMQRIVKEKPDAEVYMNRMLIVVGKELQNAWTLKYSGWLLVHTPLEEKDVEFILQYAKKYHMNASKLGEFCFDVAATDKYPHQVKRVFIEKAIKTIVDKKQKGIASISLAAVLSEIGDNPRNNERRLSLMREAIINSAEMRIGATTVGETAMEMVYRLKNLSKGRPAPELEGVDSSGKHVKLSSYKGKVVMLVFWSSYDLETDETVKLLALMRKIEKDYLGKDFALIGVNKDQLINLRDLEKKNHTTSINIVDTKQRIFGDYRIAQSPHCYVIDKQGLIGFSGVVGSFATLTADALLKAKPAVVVPKPVPVR